MKEFIEKLIGRLSKESDKWLGIWDKDRCDNYADGMNDAFDEAIDIVNQLAEEYKLNLSENLTGWIPTTERLPEKNAIVLVCDKDGWISVKVNMPYAGVKNDFECGYYTAWMPLPEPFKTKEGRE